MWEIPACDTYTITPDLINHDHELINAEEQIVIGQSLMISIVYIELYVRKQLATPQGHTHRDILGWKVPDSSSLYSTMQA